MKLVYFWFEMDKIQDAVSFNMGSQYVFTFNKENSELTYEDNPYYIDNFFKTKEGQLSIELNGIVGANGVGKTSILYMIKSIITGKMVNKYILVIEKDGVFLVYTNSELKIDNENLFLIQTDFNNKIFNTIYFSNVIDAGYFRNKSITNAKNIFSYKYIDVSTNYLIKKEINLFYIEDLYNQIIFVDEFGKSKFSLICSIPQNIYLYLPLINLDNDFKFFSEEAQMQLRKVIRNNMYEANNQKNKKEKLKVGFYRKLLKTSSYYIYLEIHNLLKNDLGPLKMHLLPPFEEMINEFCISQLKGINGQFTELKNLTLRQQFFEIKNLLNALLTKENKLKPAFIEKFDVLEKEIKIISNFINNDDLDDFKGDKARMSLSKIDKDVNNLFGKWNEHGMGSLIWTDMSSGEYGLLNMFSRIYAASKKLNFNSRKELTVLLIDEGELYFHPQWQKQMVKILLDGIQVIFEETNKPVQIILTTHSPFILSDIPSDRILFLKQVERDKVVCLNNLEDTQLTFGANIHYLYSNAFFLQDGLMGDFAKEKINNLINEILTNTPEYVSNNAEKIRKQIHMIGEPIIKKKLVSIYEEQLKLLKPAQIEINDEITRLKERMIFLENKLNNGDFK